MKARPPINGSDWAEEYFYLSAESSAVEGKWESLPYQKAILNTMCNDDIPEVTFQKSTRQGYTKMVMIASFYFTEHKHRSQAIWQPTDSDAEDFVKDEIDTAIRDVPVIRKLFKSDPDKRNSGNTLSRKEFVGATLDIKGGKSARNYRRMTKDVAIYDELDGFDRNIDNEGNAVVLGDKRLQASPFPKSIRGSTPRLKYLSLIEDLFDSAEMRFYRYAPCPECFHGQRLLWANVKWDNRDYRTARYECENCGEGIDYSSYADMDACGVWRTVDGRYWVTDEGQVKDTRGNLMEVRHIAFHLWAAYSYFVTWSDLVREFLTAKDSFKRTGDKTLLQSFANTVLAETWEEDQGEQPSWEALRARAEPYTMWEVPMDAGLLIASVDTQNNRLELLLEAYGPGEECWTIGHEVLIGDPFSQDPWDALDEWLDKEFKHESGAMMRIAGCAIDSGGQRTQAVYNYVRKSRFPVIALKGMNTPGKPVIGKPTPQDVTWGGLVHKSGVKLWPVGSDTAKAVVYGRYRIQEKGPGYFHTPIGLPDEFYQQATAEKLVTKMHKGYPGTEWMATGRNEITDLKAYGYACAIKCGLLRINWEKKQKELQDQAEQATFLSNKKSLSKEKTLYRKPILSEDPYM